MSFPTITVRIAFATGPLATPTWTDVSDYLEAFRIKRGRQDELNRVEAGTAEVKLRNRDRRFDPTYTSGPYYGTILPMRRINIRAVWSAVTYDLYTGYVEAWPTDWPLRDDSSVTLPCADAFTYFSKAELSVSPGAQTADLSISDILTLANWPPADKSLNTGASTLQAWSESEGNVLAMFQRLTDSENGYLWMGTEGKVYFRERYHRLLASTSNTSQATFGDGVGELPYSAIEPSFDDTFIFNDVRITRTGGVQQTNADSASISAYFRRPMRKTDLLMATDAEAADAVNWLLNLYKEPALRIKSLTVNPQTDNANLWPQVLARDFHNRITVKRTPPGGGNVLSLDCYIEGVEHVLTAGPQQEWTTTWNLSPTTTLNLWLLDDAVLSVLNSTTILAY